MPQGTTRVPYFKEMAVDMALLLVPTLALIHGFYVSGTWRAALNAWQGKYVNRLTGLPSNPWLEVLPILCGLLAIYIASIWSALALSAVSRKGRLVVGIALSLVGAVLFFGATLYASLAYLSFGDFKFGGMAAPNSVPLIAVISFAVLFLNAYQVVRVNGRTRQLANSQQDNASSLAG